MSEEETPKYKDISQQLIAMGDKDLKMLLDHQSGKAEFNPRVHKENLEMLKEIVEKISWPTISKVGKKASRAAWLIAQHADFDVEFQEICLQLMLDTKPNDVDLQDIAYLVDRVAVNKGEKQTYGTQFFTNEAGELVPRPIKDRKRLNTRRRKMGLEPFETYAQTVKSDNNKAIKAKSPNSDQRLNDSQKRF